MNFDLIRDTLPLFAIGALYTIAISAFATVLGAVLGFIIHGIYRRFPKQTGAIYGTYVWILRGTPFLVQLFVVYYGLPAIGISMSAVGAAIITLAIYGSAYFAEIFRASWNSVPKGHAEAAVALGISRWSIFTKIEMPQALRFSVPLLVNQTIIILKESSLASIITVPELTMTAGRIVAETYSFMEPYLILALAYWVLTYITSIIGRRFERFFIK